MMRKLITLLPVILLAMICLGVVYGFTIKGTVYVISGKSVKPLNEVVSQVSPYWVTVKTPQGTVVAEAKIYPNSSFVVKGLENSETYLFYLSSKKGSIMMLINTTFGILQPARIQLPPYGRETSENFYVRYTDLEKILVPVVVRKPVMKYTVISFIPSKVTVGKEYYAKVNVTNVGNATGVACLKMYANSTLLSSKCVAVEPETYKIVTLAAKFTTPGTYVVSLYANTTLLKKAIIKAVKVVVPVKVPKISVVVVSKLPSVVYVGKVYKMTIKVENTGNGTGTAYISVYANSSRIFEKKLTVSPGAVSIVTVPVNLTVPGTYIIKVLYNGTLVFSETVKAIPKPTKPYSSVSIPSTFYVNVPKMICLTLINIYNKVTTFNVTAVGYVTINGVETVAGKSMKLVTLEPGQTEKVCLSLTFEKYGESPKVVIYLNSSPIAEKTVTLEKVPTIIIGSKRTYVVLVNKVLNIPVTLENIKGYIAGIAMIIKYNPQVLTVLSSTTSEISQALSKCFPGAMVKIYLGKGAIRVGVVGTSTITVNECKFVISFKTISLGKSLINATGTITSTSYQPVTMGVVPTVVIVRKAIYIPVLVASIVRPLPKTMIMKEKYMFAVKISNIGNATGTGILVTTANGSMIFRKVIRLAPGASTTLMIPVMLNKTGRYVIHVKLNGTDVKGSPMIVTVIRVRPFKVISVTIPEVFYVNVSQPVVVTVMNNSTKTITLTLSAVAVEAGKIVDKASETIMIEPGKTATVKLPLKFKQVGTGKVYVYINGSLIAEKMVEVKKLPPYAVYVSLKPKEHVYWAGYPVTLNVTVIPRVKSGVAINITVIEATPYSRKVVASLFKPLEVGAKYTIVKRLLLPTYTTTGVFIILVNGMPVAKLTFMTTGVAVVVKPRTYELISVPILPLSYVVKSQSIPTPPPGSAPVRLPTLSKVFSLVYDAETGKPVYPWSAIAVYYYNRMAMAPPYYVPVSPTSTPVRPGEGLVVYSVYPHELVMIVPINVTAISTTTLKILLAKTIELAYIPSPFRPGWALVGPLGLVPIRILPSKIMNITLYYTESTTGSEWTSIEPVTVGEYMYPGKGYWIFWNIVTFHAVHSEMMRYLTQYYSVLAYTKCTRTCK